MPATVADVEGPLIRRNRVRMLAVGMSTAPSTPDAPNPDTLDAISWGMEALRRPPAAYGSPTDDEVGAAASAGDLRGLADFCLLESILAGWTRVDETVQSRSKSNSDLLKALEDRLAYLRKVYARFLIGPVVMSTTRVRTAQSWPAAEL